MDLCCCVDCLLPWVDYLGVCLVADVSCGFGAVDCLFFVSCVFTRWFAFLRVVLLGVLLLCWMLAPDWLEVCLCYFCYCRLLVRFVVVSLRVTCVWFVA